MSEVDKQALLQAEGLVYPEYLEVPILFSIFRLGDRVKIPNKYLYRAKIQTFSIMPWTYFEVVEITANHYRVAPVHTLVMSESDIIPNKGTFLIRRRQKLVDETS